MLLNLYCGDGPVSVASRHSFMSMFACFALVLNSSVTSFLGVMPVIHGLGILFHLLLVDLCASVAEAILRLVKTSDLARIRGGRAFAHDSTMMWALAP